MSVHQLPPSRVVGPGTLAVLSIRRQTGRLHSAIRPRRSITRLWLAPSPPRPNRYTAKPARGLDADRPLHIRESGDDNVMSVNITVNDTTHTVSAEPVRRCGRGLRRSYRCRRRQRLPARDKNEMSRSSDATRPGEISAVVTEKRRFDDWLFAEPMIHEHSGHVDPGLVLCMAPLFAPLGGMLG